jgi:polyisoprenoid-binding protein YceI
VTVAVGHYLLDKSASKFTVRAFATGMLSALGHSPTIAIRDFNGEADFDPAAPEQATLKIEIRAGSLQVTDDIKSKDRAEMESTMNQQVLETAKYPSISYEGKAASVNQLSEGRYQVNMNGSLSLHGTTGNAPLALQVLLMGDMLRASGEFTLLQSDYGIQRVSVAGGTLKLKDELKFNFDIVARKQV